MLITVFKKRAVCVPFETSVQLHNQRFGTKPRAPPLVGVSLHKRHLQWDLLPSDQAMLPLIHE